MSQQFTDQEKTEEPTQSRLDKAREEGNVSISAEISSVILMGVSLVMVVGTGGVLYNRLHSLFETFFINSAVPLENQDQALEQLEKALWLGMEMTMPLLTVLLVTALLVNLIQTEASFSIKALQPKASKINPAQGIKRIFSMKGFVELVKGFLKLFIVGLVVYLTVKNDIGHFVSFIIKPLEYSISETGSYVLQFISRVLAALFILSIADALYQRFQHKKDLRMTKQEVKDDHKQSEGDPFIKSQRRKMGMSFRNRKRLDHAVLQSDVVVTNPTHYAVALKYKPDENDAPVVVAKGQRLKALKIKELANEHGIPMVENKPVAQALFASAEEDEPIPADLYRAVAEILAYVYKLKTEHKL